MRKPLIAANWKMYKTEEETSRFLAEFLPLVKGVSDVEIVIAPPFTSLSAAGRELKNTGIGLSGQNLHFEKQGAFTGEISADMLIRCGCTHVIIGHSERRQYFGEADEILNRKVKAAISAGLKPVFCVGETLQERESGKTFEVVTREMDVGLSGVDPAGLIIAYEPVWAIGTGRNATPEQAQEVHVFIRSLLAKNSKSAENVRILYGGSVKPENIGSLMIQSDIDGALVGGASLDPVSFSKLVKYK